MMLLGFDPRISRVVDGFAASTKHGRHWAASGHLRLYRPVSGAAGQPQEADSANSIEPA
jgi:hypothetical protein